MENFSLIIDQTIIKFFIM